MDYAWRTQMNYAYNKNNMMQYFRLWIPIAVAITSDTDRCCNYQRYRSSAISDTDRCRNYKRYQSLLQLLLHACMHYFYFVAAAVKLKLLH
jgi:hypothetical protein